MLRSDIIVIGGGPAGAVFASRISDRYSVTMIYGEKQKPCGGLLSEDAQLYFAERNIVLPKDITVDPQVFAVDTIDIDQGLTRRYQRFYINTDRSKFDGWMRSFVPDKVGKIVGTVIKIERGNEGFTVTYLQDGMEKKISGEYIVGADGANSIVRHTLFRDRRIRRYVSIQQSFPAKDGIPNYACIFDRKTTECCAWLIKKDGETLFGGVFSPDRCRDSFEEMKKRMRDHGIELGEPSGTEACLVLRPKSAGQIFRGKNNAFLIGEAAGFISPSSFEGISKAMYSAEALAEAFESGAPLKYYRKKTAVMRFGIFLKLFKCPFMYSPFLRKIVMKTGVTAIKNK